MVIDIKFDFYTDAGGGDPDSTSPTLRRYHKYLWSKFLPNGEIFELHDDKKGIYLYHKSNSGFFTVGSDAIAHSYRNQKRKSWLTQQIPYEVDELFSSCRSIGSYIIFPNNRIEGKQTINGARGCNSFIDDRFDLTLECIRRFYLGLPSPLGNVLIRYKNFFDLFIDFTGYVEFFFLQDLIDQNHQVQFYLPFDCFETRPRFRNVVDYLTYKEKLIAFVASRNNRIIQYCASSSLNDKT